MSEEEIQPVQKFITFTSEDFQLKGTLHLPPEITHPPVVIGSHGLLSDADSPKQKALAEACLKNGIAYFRFSHRGCGQSEGEPVDAVSLEGRCTDLVNAISTIRAQMELSEWVGLFGSSFGGTASLCVAKQQGVNALITLAAPLQGEHVAKAIEISEDPEMEPYLPHLEKLRFNVTDKIRGIHHILIFHGDCDRVVSPSEAHRIYERAEKPKRLIMLRNGDHRLSDGECREKFIREAVLWFKTSVLEEKSIHSP